RTSELARPAVVDENDVKMTPRRGPMEMRRVRRNALSCCTPCEETKEHRKVFCAGDDLLDAHAGDMDGCKVDAHVGVTFIRTNYKTASFRDSEIHSCQRSVGQQEFFTQVASCRLREFLWIVFASTCPNLFMKDVADLLLLEMNGRHHDMAGRFAQELHDAFSQVGVHHFDTVLLEIRVKMAFFSKD